MSRRSTTPLFKVARPLSNVDAATVKATARARMSEEEFTRQVLQLAKLRGWRTLHIRPARTAKGWRTPVQGDGVGFPDLVMVRGPRLLFVELKSERGKTTAEQEAWLSAIREVDAHSFGVEVYVWRPSDWAMIEWKLA